MKWSAGDRDNIEERRSRSGLRGGVPLGIGGIVILALLSYATGTDFLSLLDSGALPVDPISAGQPPRATSPGEEYRVNFVDAVARDTQATWAQVLGPRYERTVVVLFTDAVESACGAADAATGPFYCPADRKVYLDLGFFDELSRRFGAPGEFAQAYVIAHEFGHHVQNLLGTNARVGRDRAGANSASVALELQADCYAGIWGHAASQQGRFQAGQVELEPGDAEEALNAAAAIGDDRLQRMGGRRVAPERFTHGTSEQRVAWFRRGMESGDPARCDTFAAR
ncbi:MAG: neutral zinc metallopeptidase [Vicinamibacterales bacterium]